MENKVTLRNLWQQYRAAVIIAISLAIIYIGELLIAGSFRSGATYTLNSALYDQYGHLMRIVAPFLHSSHSHISSNLAIFLGLSVLILSHERDRVYLLVFVSIGWITASIYPLYFGGGLGWGISGANAGLGGWESVYRTRTLWVSEEVEFWSVNNAKLLIGFTAPIAFTILMIAQGTGDVDVDPGTSVLGHFSGAIVGLVFGIIWYTLVRNHTSSD